MYDVRARRCAGIMFGAILGVLTGFTSGCETNPYTGRSQLLMTSVSQEMQLGAQAYNQVKNDPKMKPSQDPKEIEPVKRVAARIVEAAKRSKYAEIAQQFQWEVTVIKDDKTANAFALPGGKMAVYTGIFPMAESAPLSGHHGGTGSGSTSRCAASLQSQTRIGSRLYRHTAGGRRRLRSTGIGGSLGTDVPDVWWWRASRVHVHASK
jgi:hypothetical protein